MNSEGVVNLAPFSFFNCFGSNPPLVIFAPGNRPDGSPKDTARNLQANQEFVIHTVEEDLVEAMNNSSAALDPEVSEVEKCKLDTLPSVKVAVPRLAQSRVAFECLCHSVQHVGANRFVVGRIVYVHLADGLVNPENLRLEDQSYAPVGRLGSPNWYSHTTDRFTLDRPGFTDK